MVIFLSQYCVARFQEELGMHRRVPRQGTDSLILHCIKAGSCSYFSPRNSKCALLPSISEVYNWWKSSKSVMKFYVNGRSTSIPVKKLAALKCQYLNKSRNKTQTASYHPILYLRYGSQISHNFALTFWGLFLWAKFAKLTTMCQNL